MQNQIHRGMALLALLGVLGCGGRSDNPSTHGAVSEAASTQPAVSVAKVGPVQTASPGTDYSQEVSRLVYEKDEIVAVLANGMVVIAKRVPSPVVSVRGYVKAGGVYEGQWLGGGLSHLLEHLVAGGTNDRRSEQENRNLLQQIGNNSNAYTTAEHTAYFVNTTAENMEKAADLVTGWMLGAKITPAEYQREYEVVQRELEMGEGDPDRQFYYQTQRNRYQVSPARVPVIGYQEVIRGLSRDDVYAYYKLAYVPNNMVFAVSGNTEPEKMIDAVKRYVKDAPPGRAFEHDIAEEPPVSAPRTLVSTFPKLGAAKLELGFPTVKLGHADMYPLDLLATILATGESSLLVEELRDRRGLVTEVSAMDFTPHYADGAFAVSMTLPTAKIPEATAAVLEVLERVKNEGVSEERLKRAKVQTKSARAFSQQTSESVGASLATDLISTGDPHFSDRYVERMERVTAEQVKDAARRYLDRSRLLTTAMLPAEEVGEGGLARAEEMLRTVSAAATQPATKPAGAAKVTRVVLKDGTTLLLKRVDTAPVVVMRMYSLGGVTAEDEKTNGLGNLAMRLTPRGTKDRSAQEIAEFFDSVGGELSASSGNNSWSWSATCLKEDFGRTFEVFADVVRNAAFPDEEVKMMKQRVLEQIKAQDAEWFNSAYRFFRKSYFAPARSPYQFMALGTAKSVEKFGASDVRRWYAEKVLAGRKVLAVYGDIDVEATRDAVARQFGGIDVNPPQGPAGARGTAEVKDVDVRKATITVQRFEVNRTANPQSGVIIGFRADPVVGDSKLYPLTVADTLTSGFGYPTGYIFEILRGRGLVYDANAQVFPGRSPELPGVFMAYAGCEAKDVNEVVDVMLESIARLQGTPQDINTDWFARAKELIVTSDALDMETAAEQAETAALDELLGLGHDFHDQFARRIEGATVEDVRRIARVLLRECVVTVTTDKPELVQAKEGVRTYDAFAPVDLTPRGVQHDSK